MKKSLIPLILILSAFFLFGCSVGDLLPGEDEAGAPNLPVWTMKRAAR